MKTTLAILVALVVPGGCLLLALNAWLKWRAAQRDAAIFAERITPPVQTFEWLSPEEADRTRAEASRRRAATEYQQKRAAQIASGVPVEERILFADKWRRA